MPWVKKGGSSHRLHRGSRGLRCPCLAAVGLALACLLYVTRPVIHRWLGYTASMEMKHKIWAAPSRHVCPAIPAFVTIGSWREWARQIGVQRCANLVPLHSANGTVTSLPLFVILGEQKCGTTFLRTLLGQQPMLRPGTGIYGKEGGETHFFDWGMMLEKVEPIPELMMKSYARYFTSKSDKDAFFGFDTSPSYLAWPDDVPKRVKLIMPDIRMIVLLRDPVERYESAVRMSRCHAHPLPPGQEFHTDGAMDVYLRTHPHSLHLTRGMYQRNLARWLEYFDREQFLIIESSELYRHPEVTLKTVMDFLVMAQIAPDVRTALREGRNEGCTDGYRLLPSDRTLLSEFYQLYNRALEDSLGVSYQWSKSTRR